MTTIIYKDKKYKLPFVVKSHSTAMVKRTNRLSGQSIDLPGFAACVYDYTMYMSATTEEKDRQTNQMNISLSPLDLKKIKKAASRKLQATSNKQLDT